MKEKHIFRMLMLLVMAAASLSASAELVDRATFDQYLQQARAINGSLKKAPSSTAAQAVNSMPFVINDFSLNRGDEVTLAVTFNTCVMSDYRTECCPRVGQFDLLLPAGLTVVNVSRGSSLQYNDGEDVCVPISVYGNYDSSTGELRVLGIGMCDTDELEMLPTGELEYALITVRAEDSMAFGVNQIIESGAKFAMADEPSEFYYEGTVAINATLARPLATGITLSESSLTLNTGESLKLDVVLEPADAEPIVQWTSSDDNVATVDANGNVTAVARGNATITATTTDGTNLRAQCVVEVRQLATGISLDCSETTIIKGETLQLTATVTPSNANNKAVTWTTSDASVATVSDNGLVTAVGNGRATITATTADGSNLSAQCLVEVVEQSMRGDVNGDGSVDGSDINVLINIVLGKDNEDKYGGRADVNGDGTVDGSDINVVINIVLGK